MALATSNLSVKSILTTLGVTSAKAIFYNGSTLRTVAELGTVVTGSGLNETYCPGADDTAKLTYLRTNRKLSCFKGYDHAPYYLTASETNCSFEGEGDSKTINITSNESWNASTSYSWIEISTGSGTGDGILDFTVTENNEVESRTGRITVASNSGLSITIEIYQNPIA